MSSDTNDNVEESANWVEEIQRELQKIGEMMRETETGVCVVRITDEIASAVKKRREVEEKIRKENKELKKQLSDQKLQLDEMEMERDVLLQQIHAYLEINSSLRIRLEEQRCQNGALKSQLNADLEARVRVLEKDKEKLIDLNLEKEKEVDRMRFMIVEARRRKEWNEENDVTALKKELQRALEDKVKAEERLRKVLMEQRKAAERPWKGRKREPPLRRSASEGDVGSERFESFEKNMKLEGHRDCISNCKLREKGLRTEEGSIANRSDCSADAETKKKKFPEPPVHAQLDALRRGLFNVTRKLECLKTQLVNSGAIKEEVKDIQRNLKRKAKTMEMEVSLTEESKSGFKDLKNILEDAKTLSAKLENLRDEKQKIIDMTKRENEVQVETKKNDMWSQTSETRRHFEKTVTRLKKAICECEAELDKGSVAKEEAFASFTSALILFILSNFTQFSPGCWNVNGETDPFREEGLCEPNENGGGDNPLKIFQKPQNELKVQIARLKFRIEFFENLRVL